MTWCVTYSTVHNETKLKPSNYYDFLLVESILFPQVNSLNLSTIYYGNQLLRDFIDYCDKVIAFFMKRLVSVKQIYLIIVYQDVHCYWDNFIIHYRDKVCSITAQA